MTVRFFAPSLMTSVRFAAGFLTVAFIAMACLVNPLSAWAEQAAGNGDDPQSEAAVSALIQMRLSNMLTAIGDSSLSNDTIIEELRSNVDFPAITRGVMGKAHRKAMSTAQQARFQGEFEQSMVVLLRSALSGDEAYTVEAKQTRLSTKNPERAQTFAVVSTPDGQQIDLIASLAFVQGNWKVRNLIFEGINLGRTYRSQFDQLMQDNGGNPDAAIDAWAEQVGETTPG